MNNPSLSYLLGISFLNLNITTHENLAPKLAEGASFVNPRKCGGHS